MTQLNQISPEDVASGMTSGNITLIDIREADEYSREYIKDALNIPLSALTKGDIDLDVGKHVVFHCRSGNRTEVNCDQLATHVEGHASIMEGGLNAWKSANLPVVVDTSVPIELNRQVQITAGFLTLIGVVLGYLVHPVLFGISAFIGGGLMFSGLSGTCAMAGVLMRMPWNRKAFN
ncbi:rhodanese family protein [Robiginitomaculum antarcticum]|uniref:rhodanese family protein n=1 Tax=Robiginitomaculum antarcticum TaxID=437507 RepID=UPI00037FC743|nr:rhodanese family protein [Robiginitomaculum antarcticum]